MPNAKLMTPLFYQDNFNADGKKMRALFLREVSNGTDTYRLWRRDGKPDREYPPGRGRCLYPLCRARQLPCPAPHD